MGKVRSFGAATLLAGLLIMVIAPWLGVWAALSSNPKFVWWSPLVVGLMVTLSGATMLFLAWVHDRGKATQKDVVIDEFTMARIRTVWAEDS